MDAIRLPHFAHVRNHVCRTFQPEAAAEEIVGRTKCACEWAPTAKFERKMAAIANVGKEMKSRERQSVKVQDQRGVRRAYNSASLAECDACDCGDGIVCIQGLDQGRKCFLRLTANHEINEWKRLQRGDIHN